MTVTYTFGQYNYLQDEKIRMGKKSSKKCSRLVLFVEKEAWDFIKLFRFAGQ